MQTLGAAATYGLIDQANLKGAEYSMLVTLFYLGYLLAEYPSTFGSSHLSTSVTQEAGPMKTSPWVPKTQTKSESEHMLTSR